MGLLQRRMRRRPSMTDLPSPPGRRKSVRNRHPRRRTAGGTDQSNSPMAAGRSAAHPPATIETGTAATGAAQPLTTNPNTPNAAVHSPCSKAGTKNTARLALSPPSRATTAGETLGWNAAAKPPNTSSIHTTRTTPSFAPRRWRGGGHKKNRQPPTKGSSTGCACGANRNHPTRKEPDRRTGRKGANKMCRRRATIYERDRVNE